MKNPFGIIVGKLVLSSQFIPIGNLSLVKRFVKRFYLKKAKVKHYQSLMPNFLAKNKKWLKNGSPLALEVSSKSIHVPNSNAVLDTLEIKPKGLKKSAKVVICAWGRWDCYEAHLDEMATYARKLGVKVVTFNFRGVNHSTDQPSCGDDLVQDCIAQVNAVIQQGVDPQHIILKGHSLSGATLTQAAAQCHKSKKRVKLFNDRSFDNMKDTSTAMFLANPRNKNWLCQKIAKVLWFGILMGLTLGGIISGLTALLCFCLGLVASKFSFIQQFLEWSLSPLVQWVMHSALKSTGWEMNAKKAYETLPATHKHYLVLRGKTNGLNSKVGLGQRYEHASDEDRIVPYEVSLHKGLKKQKQARKELKQKLKVARKKNDLVKEREILDKLIDYSNSKVSGGRHKSPLNELFCRYKGAGGQWVSAQHVFFDFVNGKKTKPKVHRRPFVRKSL